MEYVLVILFMFGPGFPARIQILVPSEKVCHELGNKLSDELKPMEIKCVPYKTV